MINEKIRKMKNVAFKQSIRSYNGKTVEQVAVFGLDTEYVSRDDYNELLCWQLASKDKTVLLTSKLNIANLYGEALKLILDTEEEGATTLVFATYFSMAELQFLDLNEWRLLAYKGKYALEQFYNGVDLQVVDLIHWYDYAPLNKVAELWGTEKLNYPIRERMTQIKEGKLSKKEILKDKDFVAYAKRDAEITQQVYSGMRHYFLSKYFVDPVRTKTPAHTAACIFRRKISTTIGQRNTHLRKQALKCCWGGRMESCFHGEKEIAYEYDAVQHHPSSAIALKVLPLEEDWKSVCGIKKWLEGISGLGEVRFRFPDSELYPCLPVFDGNALVFPLEGISHCTVSEARKALEWGAELHLISGWNYHKGTAIVADHFREIREKRNVSTNEAERALLKLLSNSLVGKFYQRNEGKDLEKVKQFALENQLELKMVIKLKNVDFSMGNSVGSCFYPEWYALILGYARASISEIARKYQALNISSDSFITELELPSSFTSEEIQYKLKEAGSFTSYRTRLYRIGDKFAHHAVHNKEASKELLQKFLKEKEYLYGAERFIHLNEAWRTGKSFGFKESRPMTVQLGFDYKRQLLEGGTTKPWKDIAERANFLRRQKMEKHGQLPLFVLDAEGSLQVPFQEETVEMEK